MAECCFEVAPVDADQAEDDVHLGEPHRAAHSGAAGFAVCQDLPGCCLSLVVLAQPLVAAGCVERSFRPVEREVAGLVDRREPVQEVLGAFHGVFGELPVAEPGPAVCFLHGQLHHGVVVAGDALASFAVLVASA